MFTVLQGQPEFADFSDLRMGSARPEVDDDAMSYAETIKSVASIHSVHSTRSLAALRKQVKRRVARKERGDALSQAMEGIEEESGPVATSSVYYTASHA